MSTSSHQLLDSFDRLPESEKRAVASEIIRRTLAFDLPQLSDEELVIDAEQVFLELDRRESEDGHSQSG